MERPGTVEDSGPPQVLWFCHSTVKLSPFGVSLFWGKSIPPVLFDVGLWDGIRREKRVGK